MSSESTQEPSTAVPKSNNEDIIRNARFKARIGLLLLICPAIWFFYFQLYPEAVPTPYHNRRQFNVFLGYCSVMAVMAIVGVITYLVGMTEMSASSGLWAVVDIFLSWIAALPVAGALMDGEFMVDWFKVTFWFVVLVWIYLYLTVVPDSANEVESKPTDGKVKET